MPFLIDRVELTGPTESSIKNQFIEKPALRLYFDTFLLLIENSFAIYKVQSMKIINLNEKKKILKIFDN